VKEVSKVDWGGVSKSEEEEGDHERDDDGEENIRRGEVLRRRDGGGGRREGASYDKLEFAEKEIEVDTEQGEDIGEVDARQARLRQWHWFERSMISLTSEARQRRADRKSCNSQTPISP